MHHLAFFAVAHAHNLLNGLPVRVLRHRMIELPARYKIDVLARHQCLVRLDVPVRPDERNLQPWIALFDLANQLDVTIESNGRGVQHQKLVVLADLNGLLPVHLVRRRIQQPASRN